MRVLAFLPNLGSDGAVKKCVCYTLVLQTQFGPELSHLKCARNENIEVINKDDEFLAEPVWLGDLGNALYRVRCLWQTYSDQC